MLTERRRREGEDMRSEEERLNPSRAQRWNCSKLSKEIGRINQRGRCSVIKAAGRNQCHRAGVIRATSIYVNALVKLRGNT
jgi:hypothetical protein